MDQFILNTKTINEVNIPASKSFSQRTLLASALCNKLTQINNIGACDDVLHIKQIISQLGAIVSEKNNAILVKGLQSKIQQTLNCGESGLGIRLTTPIASTFGKEFTINGSGSLLKRPLKQFSDFLPQMGVNINPNGKLPLKISGQLMGGDYTVDGSLSSQYISGLLMALPLCKDDSTLTVNSPTSLPYIDITLSVLKDFGIEIKNHNYTTYTIKGNQKYQLINESITIEGDWSSATFWIVSGLINDGITIHNLNKHSVQADKAILEVIKLVGGRYKWIDEALYISTNTLKPFDFDATNCPDLFPILVVLAASINGKSTIKGVRRLKHKESDRGLVLQNEFKKLGLKIIIQDDLMTVYGTSKLDSGIIDSHNDHRIAMSAAIASNLTTKGLQIINAEAVNKSYPEFWNLL